MIDRRTFLARSTVATALAAAGMHQGGVQASPLALPATVPIKPTVEVVDDVQELEAFNGLWSTYDQVNKIFLGNHVELWATREACGMTVHQDAGDFPLERIEFEDPTIAWAFTCMMRLMRKHSNHHRSS